MDLSDNRSDWLTIAARRGTVESSGSEWWSVMTLMRLVSKARAQSSSKILSGIVTSSR
jgi:hypothetical protein